MILNRREAVTAGALLLSAVAFFLHEVGNSDLFWHLKAGEILAATGELLGRDAFSFTAEGARWMNLEWLAGLIFFLTHRAAGFAGLSLLSLALGAGIAFALYAGVRRVSDSAAAALLLVFLTFLAGAERFSELRAELFGYLCFASALLVLFRASRTKGRALYLLLPIMVLWANTHPSAILGPTTAALFFAFEPKQGFARPVQRMALVTALCFLAVLANPFTFQVYAFPFRELSQSFMLASSSDWHSPFRLGGGFLLAPWILAGLTAACVFAAPLLRGRMSPAPAILAFVLLLASLKVGRFIPFAMIAASFLFASLFGERARLRMRDEINGASAALPSSAAPCDVRQVRLGRASSGRLASAPFMSSRPLREAFEGRSVRIAVVALCVLASLIAMKKGPVLGARFDGGLRLMLGRTLGAGFDASIFPVEAADFIERRVFGGRPFNDMAWGGYLIWRLWPREQVFIDTRTAVYGDAFIREYSDALFDQNAFEALQQKYNFNYVIYDAAQMEAIGGPLPFLAHDPRWLKVLRTKNAVVYLKVKQ